MGFVMSSRLAAELDHALERNDWSAEDVKWLVGGTILGDMLLVRRGTHVIIEIEEKPMDPLAAFFRTRSGFCVWGEFTNWILAPALTIGEVASAVVGNPFDLPKNMTDGEICRELGEKYVFEDAKAFCLYLKDAFERQGGTAPRGFCTNGSTNIFYVRGRKGRVFAVGVYWNSDDLGWNIRAFRFGDGYWVAGRRVFPCNSEEPKAA